MKFFKLNKTEYKKMIQEYRKTCVGSRLYAIFDCFLAFTLIIFFEGEFSSLLFKEKEVSQTILSNSALIFAALLICTLISYYINFKYFYKYIDSKNKQD